MAEIKDKVQWYDACIAQQRSGDREGAIDDLKELIEAYPDYALAYAALSAFHGQMDQYDDAIAYGEKYVELEPEDPFGFTTLSSLYQKAGNLPKAEEALMKSRQLTIAAQFEAQQKAQEAEKNDS
jgi:tetratricopeptide (TPR) repeat protein